MIQTDEQDIFASISFENINTNFSSCPQLSFSYAITATKSQVQKCSRTFDRLFKTFQINFPPQKLSLGFQEALTNAYEHGIHALGSDYKESLLQDSSFEQTLTLKDELITTQYIYCSFIIEPNLLTISITDTGQDRTKPTPPVLPPPNHADKASGRGLAIIHSIYDEVEWSDKGHTCTMRKYRT